MKRMLKWAVLALLLVFCTSMLWGCGKDKTVKGEATTDVPDIDHATDDTGETTAQTPVAQESVVFNSGDLTLRFVKNEQDKWVWKDDPSFPLQQSCVTDILVVVQELVASTPLDATAAAGDHGVGDAGEYLTVTNAKGGSATFYLGNLTSDARYYVRFGNDAQNVYLAPAALTELLGRTIYDMAALPVLPTVAEKDIRSLSVTDADGKTVKVHMDESGKWVNEEGISATMKMNAVLQQLPTLAVTACVDYNPSSGAAAICGLQPPAATVTMEYVNTVGTDSTFALSIGHVRGDGYLVLVNDDTTIYRMDAAPVNALLAMLNQE